MKAMLMLPLHLGYSSQAWPMLYLSGVDENQLPWRNTRGAHWITGPPRPADYFAEDDTTGPLWAMLHTSTMTVI